MICKDWLELFVKERGPVEPKTVYVEGAKQGFTRKDIKSARRFLGKYIDTEIRSSQTLWRWNP